MKIPGRRGGHLAKKMAASSMSSLTSSYHTTAMPSSNSVVPPFDARNLEIKTKSIEQTLIPLVTQITTLVNYKESYMASGKPKSERAMRAALKIGSAVEAAIERFVCVGETIADENADIQPEMYDACTEARLAGASMANLSCACNDDPNSVVDKAVLVRASRQLLSSVTRVLLLADRVLVKQVLRAEDKIAFSLSRLESTRSFNDFVKVFAVFGGEMVELAHRSGDRQHDLKSEKRKAQMSIARTSLERLTMLLLTASKTYLRHPDCDSALQCRDGVFYQMKLSLELIAICVCDGILTTEKSRYIQDEPDMPIDIALQLTANAAIKQLTEMLEMIRMTVRVGAGVRERIVSALDALCQLTQDFTDSAYTPHHQREQILDFLEECRFEMTNLIQPDENEQLAASGLEVTVERLNRRLKDLSKQLQIVAMEQISEVLRANEDQVLLSSMKACAVSGDIDGVEKYMHKFREHADHMQEVCRLLHHISITDALHVHTGHVERNMRALAPLTILAGRTLCVHPSSRIARENLEVFCDTWGQAVNDLSRVAKESDVAANGRVAAEKQAYMSLPRPGKHGTTQKPSKPITLDVEDQQKMAKVGLEMKLLTSEVDAEAEKWDEYAENDIVKRAKAMSSMAYNMYLFTRGDGPLKTTHDLFTQAEFFAEQANQMYRTVREFSYEVPGSAEKSDLSAILERIPLHCQQLQVMVKSPTVGKTATFGKVDSVIQETKNLMNEIAKLVTASFVCATKMFQDSQQGMKSSFAEVLSMGGRVPTVKGQVANRLFGAGHQASDEPRRRPLRTFPPTTHQAYTFSSTIAS
ncbi:Alpha-catulin [Caenorhabditis elegans]|uniref:Alpha-catulin n=1 Tax=Caenorhabditis elegans TaxID=6239 RepID=H2L011_CAEEL|nr:Alpha-catulin [Caenorhabditis elegans]CCD70912.3 Alpha-catulin [Caenorhabditis elegans]